MTVQHLRSDIQSAARQRLRLAAIDGVQILPSDHQPIARNGRPEAVLEVDFEGITEEQKQAALANFPGGRRFVLVPTG